MEETVHHQGCAIVHVNGLDITVPTVSIYDYISSVKCMIYDHELYFDLIYQSPINALEVVRKGQLKSYLHDHELSKMCANYKLMHECPHNYMHAAISYHALRLGI